MSKVPIRPKPPSMSPGYHEKWKACRLCTTKWTTCELKYDSGGTTAPVEDETLTGASSGHTGVVVEVEDPISGTWAGGDAAGYLTVDTLVGDDLEQGTIFEDDEAINGSTAGDNCLTADGTGIVKIWAVMWPKRMLVKWRGHWYCPEHAGFRMRPILRDEDTPVITEEERGTE
jgi:hypothetical protein